MDEKILRFRVGVVVLAAMIIGVVLIVLVGDLPNPFAPKYVVRIRFPTAPGVTAGTPVRKSGVTIGRVKEVELTDKGGVFVSAEIDGGRSLLSTETFRIGTATLLGDGVIEVLPPADADQVAEPLVDGDEIEDGVVGANPLSVVTNLQGEIESTLKAFQRAAKQIENLAEGANGVLGDNQDRIPRILEKTEKTLDQFNATMTDMNRAIAEAKETFGSEELRQSLSQMMADVPDTFKELRETINQSKKTLQRFESGVDEASKLFETLASVGEAAEKNLNNLERLTKPLGDRGPQLIDDFMGTARKVDRLLEELVEFAEKVNDSEGSLGKFINDPELYERSISTLERVERTSQNIEDLTRKALPIVDDFRVVSDTIARDPRILGVKGALDRTPLGTKNKYMPDDYMDGEVDTGPTLKFAPPPARARARAASFIDEPAAVRPSRPASVRR